MNPIRAGYYQFFPRFGHSARNTEKIIEALRRVRTDLMVLPELALTGYFFSGREEVKYLAEDPNKSLNVMSLIALCRDRNLHLVIGFAEKARDRYFNSALLLGPNGIRGVYRKIHLFNEEKKWFDPGDQPFKTYTVQSARIGMMICFDWIFPEAARILTLKGADILCHPSNLVLPYCQSAMITRCLENHVYAITCNRYGADRRPHGSIRFTGKSQIVAPKGIILHRSSSQREDRVILEIDPETARNKSITPNNHILKDRRPEFYGDCCDW